MIEAKSNTTPSYSKDSTSVSNQEVEDLGHELPIPAFDPAIHLNFQPPAKRYTFTELGLPVPKGVPDLCYTEPFQLFSEEGIRMLRREIFRRSFLDKYMRSWERAPCIITGFSLYDDDATFLKQAMTHPVTQAAVNFAFGAALQFQNGINDMGYVNVQLGAEGMKGVYKLGETPSKPLPAGEQMGVSQYDGVPIDGWHRDQTPVVLVLMLSDTSTMAGGETAVRMGDGKVINAAGAGMGAGVMMAGAYLEHAALRASNCLERVSMVNSYNFADPEADDTGTSLGSVHYTHDSHAMIRNLFMEQKLTRLRDRCDIALRRVRERRCRGEDPDTEEVEGWIRDQIHFLKHTGWETFHRIPDYVHKKRPEGVLEGYLA
ncbi:hypothetical protein ASPVEDRAFT_25189 [Aspergillus versicolor CBS 583.65]|uniref:Uncharacterized protein n=1 Tax=Aspergillus versicolor CBS 583.65 TaxID=1036611 RepID=A0A1L9P9U5_ASPVE|nr:uncharacterized protein ASPVEDRAFT_25189 [Aspergillus versicolor CBS 583.65]OJI98297.1 hypothetical protein ASPVEDRAFT_25189 [Aspergillus versicolor CBS 583.65]